MMSLPSWKMKKLSGGADPMSTTPRGHLFGLETAHETPICRIFCIYIKCLFLSDSKPRLRSRHRLLSCKIIVVVIWNIIAKNVLFIGIEFGRSGRCGTRRSRLCYFPRKCRLQTVFVELLFFGRSALFLGRWLAVRRFSLLCRCCTFLFLILVR